jgi:hypothetical protein
MASKSNAAGKQSVAPNQTYVRCAALKRISDTDHVQTLLTKSPRKATQARSSKTTLSPILSLWFSTRYKCLEGIQNERASIRDIQGHSNSSAGIKELGWI